MGNAWAIIVLLFGGGAIATMANIYYTQRRNKKEDGEKSLEKRQVDWLVQDEIIGHKNIPGLPDKDPISVRLGRMEIGVAGLQRELHPNGGSSLADTINETHSLAAQAASHAAQVAEELTEDRRLTQEFTDRFEQHIKDDAESFGEIDASLKILLQQTPGAEKEVP